MNITVTFMDINVSSILSCQYEENDPQSRWGRVGPFRALQALWYKNHPSKQ